MNESVSCPQEVHCKGSQGIINWFSKTFKILHNNIINKRWNFDTNL